MVKDRKIFQNNTVDIRRKLDRADKYKITFDIKELLPVNKNDDQPWNRIDRILNAFGLLIRVDRMNLIADLEFLRRSKLGSIETTLEMKDLSSGEKVAFALALWTWGNSKGQKTDILLVDEFDAHLNPSIAEKYIGIIKEYFVDLGVQVIMTTHNPSTVAYANGAAFLKKDGSLDNKGKYYKASEATFSLYILLKHRIASFGRGDIQKQELFDSVNEAIKKYEPVLEEHRGIKQNLYDVLNAVLFLPGVIKYILTGKFRLFKAETKAMKIMYETKNIVDEVNKNKLGQ